VKAGKIGKGNFASPQSSRSRHNLLCRRVGRSGWKRRGWPASARKHRFVDHRGPPFFEDAEDRTIWRTHVSEIGSSFRFRNKEFLRSKQLGGTRRPVVAIIAKQGYKGTCLHLKNSGAILRRRFTPRNPCLIDWCSSVPCGTAMTVATGTKAGVGWPWTARFIAQSQTSTVQFSDSCCGFPSLNSAKNCGFISVPTAALKIMPHGFG
jgi:hypothetical protein